MTIENKTKESGCKFALSKQQILETILYEDHLNIYMHTHTLNMENCLLQHLISGKNSDYQYRQKN